MITKHEVKRESSDRSLECSLNNNKSIGIMKMVMND